MTTSAPVCEQCVQLRVVLKEYGTVNMLKTCLDCTACAAGCEQCDLLVTCTCDLFMCDCGGEPDEPPACRAPASTPPKLDPTTLPHYRGRSYSPDAPWAGSPLPSDDDCSAPTKRRRRGAAGASSFSF
jgi:hypothetical protein